MIYKFQSGGKTMEDENFDVIDPAIQINVNQSRKDVKNMARNIALNEDPNKGTT